MRWRRKSGRRHAGTPECAVPSTVTAWATPGRSILIYDLNLGGGFVNFGAEQPSDATWRLKIDLPREGPITVNAETVYRGESGVAVRFVDLDRDSAARLARTINALTERTF